MTSRLPRPWRTLRGRLALAAAAGLVTAAVVFTAVGAGLIRSQAEVVARSELDRQAQALAGLVGVQAERAAARGSGLRFYPPSTLEALVGPNTRLYYSGLRLGPGAERATTEIPPVAAEMLDFGVLEEEGVQRFDFTLPGEIVPQEASAAPVDLDGETAGAILLARPPGEFVSAWPNVASRVLAAAGIGLAVALLLTLFLTSRVSRPLTAMQAATRRVADGDLRAALVPTGTQELDALADDFNHMVKELAEREGQSRDFLMRVTHDLRTPLTAIRGHASALADGVVPGDDVPRSLAAIEGEAARLETLVTDLLDLARLDARRFKLDLAEADPGEMLDRAFDAMEAAAAVRGVAYERAIEPMGAVVSDEVRVRQIVCNLLDNAIHWTPPGGRVRLEGRPRSGGGFTAAVSDAGPGIPAAERESVFQAFQAEEAPDGRRGSGLGLAISRQLARTLGGDLRVEGGEEGGSRFVLDLPAAAPGAPAPHPSGRR